MYVWGRRHDLGGWGVCTRGTVALECIFERFKRIWVLSHLIQRVWIGWFWFVDVICACPLDATGGTSSRRW